MAAPTPQEIKQAQGQKTAAMATAVAIGYLPPQEYPLPTPFAADLPLPFAHSIDLRNLKTPQYINVPEQTKQHPLFGYSVRGVCAEEPAAKDPGVLVTQLLQDAPRTGAAFRIVLSSGAVITCPSGAVQAPYQTVIETDFTANNDFGNYIQGLYGIFSEMIGSFLRQYLFPFMSLESQKTNPESVTLGKLAVTAADLNIVNPTLKSLPTLFHLGNRYLFENTVEIENWSIGNLPSFKGTKIFEQVEIQRQGVLSHQRICAFSCNNRAILEFICAAIADNNALLGMSIAPLSQHIWTVLERNPSDWERQITIANVKKIFDPEQSQLTIVYNLLDLRISWLVSTLLANSALYQAVKAIRQLMHDTFFANNKNEATQRLVLDTLKALNSQLPLIINSTPEKQQQALHAVMATYSLQQTIQAVKWQIMCIVPKPTDDKSQSAYKDLLDSIDNITTKLTQISLTLSDKIDFDLLLKPMLAAISEFQPSSSASFWPGANALYSELQTLHGKLYKEMINLTRSSAQTLVQRESAILAAQQRALQDIASATANVHTTGNPEYIETYCRM